MTDYRQYWEQEKGPIPEGYHIHHKDSNRKNNNIENLECLSPSEHKLAHMKMHGDEIRKNISIGTKKAMTKEVIEKSKNGIIEKKKTGWDPRNRKVKCIETGIIYKSVKTAHDITGICNIDRVSRGQRPVAGGYHWEYV